MREIRARDEGWTGVARAWGAWAFALAVLVALTPPARAEDEAKKPAPLLAPRGPARIDFDDRLLQGQTNKLGAVYLYQRKEPALPSLLERRRTFRGEIRTDLLE